VKGKNVMKIKLKDEVGVMLCVSNDDAQKLSDLLIDSLNRGEHAIIDGSGVTVFSGLFWQQAFKDVVKLFPEKQIRESIFFENIPQHYIDMAVLHLNHYIKYFNDAEFRTAVDNFKYDEGPLDFVDMSPDSLICPFCGENGFDLAGLKGHLMNGDCEKFNAVECVKRIF
jgi:hypothetical protein